MPASVGAKAAGQVAQHNRSQPAPKAPAIQSLAVGGAYPRSRGATYWCNRNDESDLDLSPLARGNLAPGFRFLP